MLEQYWMERVVNNQFPANADERTITTVFEPALGIDPEPDETLEERRKTVAAYWSGTGKLSKTVIQSIIKAYTGCESELWWNGIKLLHNSYEESETADLQLCSLPVLLQRLQQR